MKKGTIIIIVTLIVLAISVGLYFYFKNSEKRKLVDQIMAKYPATDADPDRLMKLDVSTLKGILSGSIR